ncbi:MAG: M6 family metalloprotease domain-containing protein [Fibrobacter sp.]|uniref:M6 family metalloprotease domain-containing protein n=1 Tax=Fibrobacter sp. TaxID=35828 RepID=UPI0025C511CF|nr:M6 family metalloprotease domain-containing protein [Fibrobacter sp.]MBR4784252.1 M6 family metalloprotease domain-containing protein [Fibrobacter sp.]
MWFYKFCPLIAIAVASLFGVSFAGPASPFPMMVKNPDGSVVVIRNVGNEKLHYTVTEDNELVVRDSLGFWNYADTAGKPTGMRVHRRGEREKGENEFLKKHNSKEIIDRFLKSRKLQLQKRDSVSVMPLRKAAPLRARANTLEEVLSRATRPQFDESITMGESNVLVILVEFSDIKFLSSTPQQDFLRYMNEDGYSENGMRWSVREYFVKNSMGVFKPTIDVAAPVTLSKTRSYYGTQETPDAAFTEAINLIKQRGDIDFSKYDNDHDKTVDYVYMIYAGVGSADSDVQDAIWPQAGDVWPTINLGSRSNPLYISSYACSGELNGMMYTYGQIYHPRTPSRTLAGIGVLVHEYSHVLGLPDFYDITDAQNYSTPVVWSLMDLGEYNTYPSSSGGSYNPFNPFATVDTVQYMCGSAPPRLNGFERFSLGWLTPRILPKVNGEVTLRGIDQNDAILIPSTNKKDYFILDYRAKYDSIAPMPSSGLLIWRINYSRTAWGGNEVNIGKNLHMYLYRADNDFTMDNQRYAAQDDPNLKGDPFPGRKGVTEFDGFVTYQGEDLGLRIYDIVEGDSSVTFKVEWDNPDPVSSSSEVASSSSEMSSSSVVMAGNSSSEGPVALQGMPVPAGALRVEAGVVHAEVPAAGLKVLRVFDVQGHLKRSEFFAGNAVAVNLNSLPPGRYVVRLDVDGVFLKKGLVELK